MKYLGISLEKDKFIRAFDGTLIAFIESFAVSVFYALYLYYYEKEFTTFIIYSTNFFIIFFSLFKIGYFTLYSSEVIKTYTSNNDSYGALAFYLICVLVTLILSFSVDYFSIHLMNPEAFGGTLSTNFFQSLFDIIYFSFGVFTTIGGTLEVKSYMVKAVVMIELFTSFSFVVFILSNLDQFKTHDLYHR